MGTYFRPQPEPETRAGAARIHDERPDLAGMDALLTFFFVQAAMESA